MRWPVIVAAVAAFLLGTGLAGGAGKFVTVTKQFAKACRNDPHGPLPDEVATVLYFSSIVVAINRCGCRITKMDDRSLEFSLSWALRQPWLDESTRGILRGGLDALGSSGPVAE